MKAFTNTLRQALRQGAIEPYEVRAALNEYEEETGKVEKLRALHKDDCLYRTHNGACDCGVQEIIDTVRSQYA